MSSSTYINRPPEQRRALQEAQQVLESLETKDSLDGFNLLAVVANPRGFHHERSPSSLTRSSSRASTSQPSSVHGGTGTNAAVAVAATDASISFTDSTIQAFEKTLNQMTEQVDVFTDTLDSWSREYLGGEATDLEYVPPDTVESLIQHLPEELQTLDLDGVQAYLEQCGRMAHKFTQRTNSIREETSSLGTSSFEEGDCEETIAPLFFQSYFDLTDPSTFCQLLVLEESADTTQRDAILTVPTDQILRLPPPDFFTPGLDRVEVALLNQVRIKSTRFFHETNRFGVLQQWISDLVKECNRVRSILESSMQNSVKAWELIPQLDQKRCDLVELERILDQANEVIRCKASIGGLLSAGQDLHAAEQIQYGRSLLASQDLGRLAALGTFEQQLAQYETLVVANLGDELIEVFLDWNNLSVSEKRTRVPDLIRGLELCNALPATGTLYGNRLMDVIRMTVRTTVGEFAEESDATVKKGVTSMTLERFMDCLDMLFEQLMAMLKASEGVCEFCRNESVVNEGEDDFAAQAITSAAELSSKSISELLRLRKDAHSLVSLEEMKRLWDVCVSFTSQFESLTDYKATGLRSTLLAQAKAFVERKHESNMSSLVAALESERWTQCDVSSERQDAITRLCLGRAVIYSPRNKSVDDELNTAEFATAKKKMSDAEVEGVRYKVVWSCLLLVEMVMTDMACAAHFKALAINMVAKVAELLRLFNSRSTQLVLGAGAIHSAARLKSINAKHLSLVTQCVGMIISLLPHVRAALMAQLPPKQHTLLNDLDTIKREYEEHNEKILNKFVTIIGGIVEHGLAPRIGNTDFDERSRSESPNIPITCCIFLEGVSTNTRKMHQVLNSLLPPDHLQDSFSRIFAYLDQNLPELFIAANVGNPPTRPPTFAFPATDEGKKRMLLEVEMTTKSLNQLPGVRPWEFTAISVLEQELDYKLRPALVDEPPQGDPRDVQPTESTEDMTDSNAQSITKLSPSTDEGENDASLHADPSNAEKDSSSNADPSEPPTASNGNNDGSPEGEGTPENQNGTADHSDTEPPKGGNGSADMSPTELTAQVSPKEGTDALVEEHSNDNGSADKSPIEVTTDTSPKVGMDAAEEKSYLSKNAHHHHEGMNGDGSL